MKYLKKQRCKRIRFSPCSTETDTEKRWEELRKSKRAKLLLIPQEIITKKRKLTRGEYDDPDEGELRVGISSADLLRLIN